jgi:lipopolysaccharide/colanic/teichoic acid biosynthesis glycosyltransferase
VPDLFGMASLWVSTRDLGGVLGLEIRQNLLIPLNRWLKRSIDLAVAGAAGLLVLPFLLAVVLWIKRVSPGPAFFYQEREGEGGRKIRVRKLRTMHLHADMLLLHYLEQDPEARDEWQRYFKLKRDPRILPGIGRLLRRTSFDEVPQLWNVLKGEMSLVGPRPFPDYHLEMFDREFRALRGRVLPGLTGLWQVSARSNGDLNVQEALDTYYIRNWSLWLDLHILARTVRAVLARDGAY